MYSNYFIIPKAVYFYCILPALILIIASIIFNIIYHKKKGTHYYIYTLNYIYNIVSILLCALLFPLLLGYSLAMSYIIQIGLIKDVSFFLLLVLLIFPIIPFITLAVACFKFVNNLKYKERLDKELIDEFKEFESTKTLNEI